MDDDVLNDLESYEDRSVRGYVGRDDEASL